MTDSSVRPRVSRVVVTAIAVTELVSLGALTVPVVLGLPIAVRELDRAMSEEAALALVLAPGAVTAMVANIVLGARSDRQRRRGSGRGGQMLAGAVGGALAMILVALAPNLLTLVIGWCLAQIAYNAVFAALYATMADLVPEVERSRVAGWFGAAALAAVVLATGVAALLPKDPLPLLLPAALLAIPVVAWSSRCLDRAGRAQGQVKPAAGRARSLWIGRPHADGQYWRVWLQRFLLQLAYCLATSFGLYFLVRRVGLGEDEAATWVAGTAAVSALLAAGFSVLVGRLAAARGAYGAYVVASCLLVAVALTVKSVGTTLPAYIVASLLLGLGVGCYYAVDLALVLRTLPAERAGQLLGLFNAARTLPQSLAPAVAPALLAVGAGDPRGGSHQNYTVLFGVGAVVALLALIPLIRMTVLRRPHADLDQVARLTVPPTVQHPLH